MKNNITVFKNLPTEFNKGSVTNLVLNNQIKLDMEFNLKRGLLKLKVKSPKNTVINLLLPDGLKKVKGVDPTKVELENKQISNLSLQANKVVNIKVMFKNTVK